MNAPDLKHDLERAQWTTLVFSLLTGFSGTVLKGFHLWALLVVPVALLGITCWWAARALQLRRQVKALQAG